MSSVWLALITGFTTGGLSCLAVQGGLLASSLAQEVEQEVSRKKMVSILITFLSSKLAAYTILGFFLGWLGTMLQLTPYMRAGLQTFIGLFMLGMALRMLNVHPIFRYFVINPPKFLTRFIRRYAKKSDSNLITAGFLGALTVFIPCGITQAMMAVALGTSNPLAGAAIMFAFVLGTSPVFFILSYLATRLGEGLHERFTKVAAILVLILGLVSLEGGLNLAGSPISFSQLKAAFQSTSAPVADSATSAQGPMSTEPVSNNITITADGSGYSPRVAQAKAGQPITLTIQSKDLYTCAQSLNIPKLGIQKLLPANGSTTIQIPAQPAGTLAYTCSMGMYRAAISVN